MVHLPFEDRMEAGRKLASELGHHKTGDNAIVLGLTRGGVPVAFAVADRLRLPLDVVVVRKIGVPWQPELAMGAIAGSALILDHPMIEQLGIAEEDVLAVVEREEKEVARREALYRSGKVAHDLAGKTVILVDDGLATGSSMIAAVHFLRTLKPLRVIVAVPVGSEQACRRLQPEADEVVCLATPEYFVAVGEWYRDFDQTRDSEVIGLLTENARRLQAYESHSPAA